MTQCAASDQTVDEVAAVAVVVEDGGSCREHEGQNVKWSFFASVSNMFVCRIVLELPAKVDGQFFARSKRPLH